MRIQIYPIKRLLRALESGPDGSATAILCSSFPLAPDKLRKLGKSLVLNFDDIPDAHSPRAFSGAQAAQVAAFVQGLDGGTNVLYVCCDSGESRSSAIASAVARYLGKDEMMIWRDPHYHPNPLVYSLQCRALGLSASPLSVRRKVWLNKRELKKAIRASGK